MRLFPFAAFCLSLTACNPESEAEPPLPSTAAQTAATPDPPADPEAPPVPTISPAGPEDAHIMVAQDFAIAELGKREGAIAAAAVRAAEARLRASPGGAGMTYEFVIWLVGGERYGVTVFRSPEGKLDITSFAKLD